jgi:hypothetical protein
MFDSSTSCDGTDCSDLSFSAAMMFGVGCLNLELEMGLEASRVDDPNIIVQRSCNRELG